MDAAIRSLIPLTQPASAPRDQTSASPRVAAAIGFRLISVRSDFDALEAEWNDLFASAGRPAHVFQSFNFCWHWANHYLSSSPGGIPGLELAIVTGRLNGSLVLILPAIKQRSRLLSQVFWMGDPVGQYGDALVDIEVPGRDTLLRDALAFLTRESKADLLWLRRVRNDSDIASILHAGMGQIVERQRAPYMTLTSAKDFASFEQRYSNKARKNRKRHARRLQEKGNIEFVRARRGEEAQRLASEAIDLKAKWLADRRLISSAVTDERMKLLLADLAQGSSRPAGTIVSALIVDGKTAASEVSFTCKNQLFMHMIAFNLEFEKCGAGGLLLEQSLRDGYAEGLAVYDMLAPGDPYKFDWCDEAHDVTDWAIPATLKGWIYAHAYLAYMRGKLKTAMKSLPEPLRRLMQASAVRKPVSIDDVADEPR